MRKKRKITLWQGCTIAIIIYVICVITVYFIAGDQFKYTASSHNIKPLPSTAPIGEISEGVSIRQTFLSPIDTITQFSIEFATYNRINNGSIFVAMRDLSTNQTVFEEEVDVSTLQDNSFASFVIPKKIEQALGKQFAIEITAANLDRENAITVYYNQQQSAANGELYLNGVLQTGALCFSVTGLQSLYFGHHYFQIMGIVGLLLACYCINLCFKAKKGKKSFGLKIIRSFTKYHFLLDQLVSRDFKTKYKRSVLGVFWSFLNPLLSMIVQYVVFSTLFQTDIQNFAVYLLIGIVFFNFFMEATNMGLTSIVSNSSLITKVYIPKYIFPISRVLSSGINFLLSFIPLMLVIICSGIRFTASILLLPFAIICVTVFCIGLSMLLASMMVFFRDTQFLWSVISMLWMYATPIFYPESILPQQFLFAFKLNPLYHFIRFARALILNGASPEPKAYLFCLLAALIPFAIGTLVFKKTQDKFILYI
ncbi:MAG: Transport permease protein [Eubacteriales bacterium]|jgi:ABC-2 type transport system permease protein